MFQYVVLGSYEEALKVFTGSGDTQFTAGASQIIASDARLLAGIAQCRLNNYEDASSQFMNVRRVSNHYGLAYLLEAEMLWAQRKDAMPAFRQFQQTYQADLLAPFAAAVMNGEFGCKDLFDSAKTRQIMEKYGSLKSADIALTLTALAPTATVQPAATPTP